MRLTRPLYLTLAALLVTAPVVAAQSTAPLITSPEVYDQPLSSAFTAQIEQIRKRLEIPGAAIAVVRDGRVIYSRGFGVRDLESRLSVTPETLFAIGSTTKAFTSASVGLLVDEGRVSFDTPMREYLPDFRLYDDYATAHATPRDLLTHRTGVPTNDYVWYGSGLDREELYHSLRYLPPNVPIRTKFQYNNLMYMTAGYMVGELNGTSWENFVRARLLNPLGMDATNFSIEAMEASSNHAKPHAKDEAGQVEVIPFRNIDAIGPAGSINSNVQEMAHWLKMLLAKGEYQGRRIISEATLKDILTPVIPLPVPETFNAVTGNSYALGWGVSDYEGNQLVWHQGEIDGFISEVSFMPEENLGVVVLSNATYKNFPAIASFMIYDEVLGLGAHDWVNRLDLPTPTVEPMPESFGPAPLPLSVYTGDYEQGAYGKIAITLRDGDLYLEFHGEDYPLKHLKNGVFAYRDSQLGPTRVTFDEDDEGNIARMSIKLDPTAPAVVFDRKN